MLIAPVIASLNTVRPLRDAERDKPDPRSKRDGKKPPAHDARYEEENPSASDREPGAVTHIDVLA